MLAGASRLGGESMATTLPDDDDDDERAPVDPERDDDEQSQLVLEHVDPEGMVKRELARRPLPELLEQALINSGLRGGMRDSPELERSTATMLVRDVFKDLEAKDLLEGLEAEDPPSAASALALASCAGRGLLQREWLAVAVYRIGMRFDDRRAVAACALEALWVVERADPGGDVETPSGVVLDPNTFNYPTAIRELKKPRVLNPQSKEKVMPGGKRKAWELMVKNSPEFTPATHLEDAHGGKTTATAIASHLKNRYGKRLESADEARERGAPGVEGAKGYRPLELP
jgi:hypothetical protein